MSIGNFGRLPEPEPSDMVDLRFEQLYAELLQLVVRRGHPLLAVRAAQLHLKAG